VVKVNLYFTRLTYILYFEETKGLISVQKHCGRGGAISVLCMLASVKLVIFNDSQRREIAASSLLTKHDYNHELQYKQLSDGHYGISGNVNVNNTLLCRVRCGLWISVESACLNMCAALSFHNKEPRAQEKVTLALNKAIFDHNDT